MTNYRWVVCGMLFFATMINYMDRQVLSLTWSDFLAPEFAWTESDYGTITSLFSLAYAVFMLFAGILTDKVGARKGYIIAVSIWSVGAMLHAFCGIATCGWITDIWFVDFDGARETLRSMGITGIQITTVSVYLFMACRFILAFGEAGNFPVAIKVTAEYFPKKDRAFAISLFNNGASVGALFAPLTIPMLARNFGWEIAYLAIGGLGYVWMLVWIFFYMKPKDNDFVNMHEYNYILQDDEMVDGKRPSDFRNEVIDMDEDEADHMTKAKVVEKKMGLMECLKYKEIWAVLVGRFMTDGVWWFFLFWTPVYISDFYMLPTDSPEGMALIFTVYLISMLSIAGGYLPTLFMNKHGMAPYDGRMRAMLYFALIQMIGFFAMPLGTISPWLLVLIIGIQAASHQSWSANLYAMVGDFFPKNTIASMIGMGGLAGGIASYLVMIGSSSLITTAEEMGSDFGFFGYEGKQAAYMAIFSFLSTFYIIGWGLMRAIIPDSKHKNR